MRCGVLLLLVLTCARGGAAADQKPADLQRFLIAKGQGYFPVALRLADGRIAVVLRGGGPHLSIHGRLDIVFSSDEGQTWTKPAEVVDTPIDDRNPAFGQSKDGTLVAAFWRTARYDAAGHYDEKLDKPVDTQVTRSSDGGKSWSVPQPIDVSDIGWGSPYGRMLTLPDGTMLMAIYGGPTSKPGEKVPQSENSYIYRSTDAGATWSRYSTPGPRNFNETSLLRVAPDRMLAAMRSADKGEVWLATSRDEGATWDQPRRVTPKAIHPADLTLLPDGRVLLVTGYRVGPFGVRAVVGSGAGEFDWDRSFWLVDDAASGDCGYPSSVILKDGRVLTVYYATASKEHPAWGTHCGAVAYRVTR